MKGEGDSTNSYPKRGPDTPECARAVFFHDVLSVHKRLAVRRTTNTDENFTTSGFLMNVRVCENGGQKSSRLSERPGWKISYKFCYDPQSFSHTLTKVIHLSYALASPVCL